MTTTFSYSTIVEFHKHLSNGATTCIAAVNHYLEIIQQKNADLNAMVGVFKETALQQALLLDQMLADGKPLLPLHGIVIALKDVLCYEHHQVTASSNMLKGFTSQFTGTAVQRLIDAGAIIIGTCNCDEFAMGSSNENSAYGPVKNAADKSRVPGGSSGGSAVAVQAGMCMLSLGSDTGGSVRQPADFCGVIGLKPTYGRISRYGLLAYASSFDCIGVFGNSVADVAAVYEVMAGHDVHDATSLNLASEPITPVLNNSKKQYRIAYFESTLQLPGLDAEIKAANLTLINNLKNEGHIVEAVPFDLLDFIVPTYYVLTTAEASSNLGRYDGIRFGHRSEANTKDLTEFYKQNRSEGFGSEVKRRILLGSFVLSAGYFDAYFTKAQQVRQLLTQQTSVIFNEFDAIFMPVSPTTAFKLEDHHTDPVAMYLADIYTVFANLTGIPGISLPLFKHSNGMPFGVQLLTNRGEELSLHQLGNYILESFNNLKYPIVK